MNEPFDIIETASLTEKSSLLSEKQNKYVFRVRPRANKIQIKQAIEKLFQKKVVNVNTCKSARNVKPVKLATASDVNTEQLLAFEKILITDGALAKLAERIASFGKTTTGQE